MTVIYDPTGILSGNLFTNEVHTPITIPQVVPVNNPFYGNGFTVTGIKASDSSVQTLALYTDFVWSPMFAVCSANTGKEVYSYILLMDFAKWSSISVTYHAVGGNQDSVLDEQIIAAGDFDKTVLANWLLFEGDAVALDAYGVDYNLRNTGVAYLFASKLDTIALALKTPSTYLDFINTDFANLRSQVNGIQSQIVSWAASFANNGVLTGTWVTAAYVTDYVTTYVNGYVNAAITAALNAFTPPSINMSGDATNVGNVVTLVNSAVVGKLLTGFVSAAGALVGTDSLLGAIEKLDGNVLLKANKDNPIFTSAVNLNAGSSINATGSASDYDLPVNAKGIGFVKPNKLKTAIAQEIVTYLTATLSITNIDLSLGTTFVVTISANTTFNFINFQANIDMTSFTLITVNDATAGRAVAFPSAVTWAGGVLPPRTTTANKSDAWSFFTNNQGAVIVGSLAIASY